ncbi:MAG: phosphoglycerate kinase [Verrucomicrobiota bacterium]
MAKKSVTDIDVKGKRALVRVDFNVPQDDAGEITDDTRIQAALPTINYLVEQGAKVILMSHLGRPKGEKKPEFTLAPVAKRLGELVSAPVTFAADCIGEEVEGQVATLQEGDILLLENVRYYSEETKNDPEFAKKLASLGDVFVNDAFGTAHRAHASTAGVADHLEENVAGFLIQKELKFLVEELETPKKPFVVVMGGAKVSDKIQVLNRLMDKADAFIVGGALATVFRVAQGHEVGKSFYEKDGVELAKEILKTVEERSIPFHLPADTRHAAEFADDAPTECTAPWEEGGFVPEGREGIDIGDLAIKEFASVLGSAGTIIWNGPMGVFEKRGFDVGTKGVGAAIAANEAATKIVGGGDSVTAANQFGFGEKMDHMSTGGGASLELLEGKELPGIAVLSDK